MLIEKILGLFERCAYIKTENVGTSEHSNDFQANSYFLQQDKWTYLTYATKACTHPDIPMYVSLV